MNTTTRDTVLRKVDAHTYATADGKTVARAEVRVRWNKGKRTETVTGWVVKHDGERLFPLPVSLATARTYAHSVGA